MQKKTLKRKNLLSEIIPFHLADRNRIGLKINLLMLFIRCKLNSFKNSGVIEIEAR